MRSKKRKLHKSFCKRVGGAGGRERNFLQKVFALPLATSNSVNNFCVNYAVVVFGFGGISAGVGICLLLSLCLRIDLFTEFHKVLFNFSHDGFHGFGIISFDSFFEFSDTVFDGLFDFCGKFIAVFFEGLSLFLVILYFSYRLTVRCGVIFYKLPCKKEQTLPLCEADGYSERKRLDGSIALVIRFGKKRIYAEGRGCDVLAAELCAKNIKKTEKTTSKKGDKK